MSEVSITMNGRNYTIACDAGQEGRILELAGYIDQKLQQISRAGAAHNDTHLMVLTSLVLADELFDARADAAAALHATPRASARREVSAPQASATSEDSEALVKILADLTKRIDGIAARVQAS